MDSHHLRVFQGQVLDQCKFLIFAAQDINAGLKSRDARRVMYAVQNLLNAGANISKMLWGQRGKKAEERAPLRDSIGISDTSPLREVTMRNHFEHMDERIDRWKSTSARKNYADMLIGPREMIEGIEPTDTFRWFDPVSADVIFWGEAFNIQSLVTEAERVIPLLQAAIDKSLRVPLDP